MDVAALLGAVFNVFLVVMIVSTMLSAGFTTTVDNLVSVLRKYWLVLAVLVVGLVLRPVAGWAIAEVFRLDNDDTLTILLPEVPEKLRSKVEEAVRLCPRQALRLEG